MVTSAQTGQDPSEFFDPKLFTHFQIAICSLRFTQDLKAERVNLRLFVSPSG